MRNIIKALLLVALVASLAVSASAATEKKNIVTVAKQAQRDKAPVSRTPIIRNVNTTQGTAVKTISKAGPRGANVTGTITKAKTENGSTMVKNKVVATPSGNVITKNMTKTVTRTATERLVNISKTNILEKAKAAQRNQTNIRESSIVKTVNTTKPVAAPKGKAVGFGSTRGKSA